MIYTLEPNLGKFEKKFALKSINENIVSTHGNTIEKFESNFSNFTKFRYTTALNSGTSSLHLGLLANKINLNDLVIVPSYTFAATINSILYCGAQPWFHDIDPNTMMLDLNQVKSSLKNKTFKKGNNYYHYKTKQKISCILPVMTFGHSIDLNKLKNIKKKYKIKILIDAAAGHFAKFKNKDLGKYNFDSCFSFNGNKNITTSSGGAFCTNNKNRNKMVKDLSRVGRVANYKYKYIGYNYRMNNLQAFIGQAQLINIKKFIKNKNKIFLTYTKFFQNNKIFKKININKNQNLEGWLFAVKTNSKILKEIIIFLKRKKIFLSYFWQPLHKQKPYKKFLSEDLKYTLSESKKILCLPSSTFLKKKEINYVLNSIKEYIRLVKNI